MTARLKALLKTALPIDALHRVHKRVRNAAQSSLSPFVRFSPAGHFYSPLPSPQDVDARRERLFAREARELPGIALNEAGQLELLRAFARYYPDIGFPDEPQAPHRYYFCNPFFGYGDGIALYCMLRHFKPHRVLEVGSGFSSALMLDVRERSPDHAMALTFIEPYPQRLSSLLKDGDRDGVTILEQPVQDVPLAHFEALEADDILFIDSSHVAKIGSDVCHLFFTVLPALKPGVIVHVHDIVWPFEYPEHWLKEGRAWNEAYLLRAFLQYNDSFEILYFNSYLGQHHAPLLRQCLPAACNAPGGSIWLRKRR